MTSDLIEGGTAPPGFYVDCNLSHTSCDLYYVSANGACFRWWMRKPATFRVGCSPGAHDWSRFAAPVNPRHTELRGVMIRPVLPLELEWRILEEAGKLDARK